jgi:CheY-like chemotaxis protein
MRLLDMHMPELDGLGVLKHLNQRRPDLPVIFLTACSSDYSRNEANTAQVVAFFLKPLHDDLAIFMKTLRAVLGLNDEPGV